MNKKVESFLNMSAEFGEAFLRRSGNGILNGVYLASRLVGQFTTVALATYFVLQLIDAQKSCETQVPSVLESKIGTPLIPTQQKVPAEAEKSQTKGNLE